MSLARRTDPIIAVATPPGRGAVGILRVSGADLAPWAAALLGGLPPPRLARYQPWRDDEGRVLDQGLALWFPAPHSFTGEDVLELQAHGGPVLLQLLLRLCLQRAAEPDAATGRPRLPGLRLAEPGEFTERAFLNGKLDLAQAEAVADLIDASTEAAARSAGRSLAGALSQPVQALAEALMQLRVQVEAGLDFPEEELDLHHHAQIRQAIDAARAQLAGLRAQARQGQLLREGMTVVLAGQPNVGKSSLLNALAGAELAIVTPVAGTTRDKVTGSLEIEGVPLHVVDTAGLRREADTADEVERIGIARAWEAIRGADAVLRLHDLTRLGEPAYDAAEAALDARCQQALGPAAATRLLHVFNKADAAHPERWPAPPALAISARTGQGLDALRRMLLERAGWQRLPEGSFIARERHLRALAQAADHLDRAAEHGAHDGRLADLLAEELRLAQQALEAITGRSTPDDLLGAIFASFCIGK